MLKFFVTKKSSGSLPVTDIQRFEREDAEYAAFLESPVGSSIRAEVDRAESNKNSKIRSSMSSDEAHSDECSVALLADSTLERAVAQAFAPPSSGSAAPSRLVALLLWRLGDRCARLESRDSRELTAFLLESLRALLALTAACPARNASMLLQRGVEEHILSVLLFARSRLLTRVLSEDPALEPEPEPEPELPRTALSSSLSLLPSTSRSAQPRSSLPTAAHRAAVVMVVRDAARLLLHVRFSAVGPALAPLIRAAVERLPAAGQLLPPEPPAGIGVAVPAMDRTAGAMVVAQDSVMTECGHLFLYCSKGTLDLDLQPEVEREMIAEVLCSLALIMVVIGQELNEQIVQVTLAGTGVQLARFLVDAPREESDSLLRQLSCSLLLVTRMLREVPVLTVQAMNSVYFFDNLVGALQAIGSRYERAASDGYILDATQKLESLADVENANNLSILSGGMLSLVRPNYFERLAESEIADEFLHCYLGLLEAHHVAKARADVSCDSVVVRLMGEIELTLLRAFFSAPKIFQSSSCLYGTLMRFALNIVRNNELDKSCVSALEHLVHSGLYRLFFHDEAFAVFRTDPCLHYASIYLLHFMMTRPTGLLLDNMSSGSGVENEVSAVFNAFLTGSEDSGTLPPLCAVLLSATRGPNSTAVLSSVLQNNGIAALAAMARKPLSAAPGRDWVPYLLTQLFREPAVQVGVLSADPGAAVALLTVPHVRRNAEEMLVSLLTHRCADTAYAARMAPLVRCVWDAIDRCVQSDSSAADAHVHGADDDEKDEVFLSILRCICVALRALTSGDYEHSWGAARQLQFALCGDNSSAMDGFLCLLHRAARPWRGVVQASRGLSCILNTIALLVRGCAALRGILFQTVSAAQFVDCMRGAWFSAHGVSWVGFVSSILAVVYEESTEEVDAQERSVKKSPRHKKTKNSNRGSMNANNNNNNNLAYTENTDSNTEAGTIQNPELLVPLLGIFLSIPRFREKHRDALECILFRIQHSLRVSRVSLWMVANAGLFEALTALIPIVTGTALLETVLSLIMTIASHHVSVRETKHFLRNIVHAQNEEERLRFVSIVIEVLNVASYAFLNRQTEKQNYIAFRECSGPTGVKAILADFPTDGYTVALWLRLERRVGARQPQCIFSLQGLERRTVIELVATSDGISVFFQDAQRRTCELDLRCSLTPHTWVHLVVVHRQSTFPFSGTEFQLFINGAEVALTNQQIPYPSILRGFLCLGTRIEDVEQRVYGASFAGQMTAVYFFGRPLPAKDVMNIFLGAAAAGASSRASVSSLVVETSGRNYAELAAVYIDPRFGERGQLHNLAALLRGRPKERPLITYEGTVACNTSSIIDSICVLGALQTVVVPLLVLLVNPQLPFRVSSRRAIALANGPLSTPNDSNANNKSSHNQSQGSNSITAVETSRKAVNDLLKLVESLLLSNVVRGDVVEVGLFPMIAYVLQQFTVHCTSLPQRLWNLCTALLPDGVVVDAAYSALFLSGDLLQACAEETQILLIRTQTLPCSATDELFRCVRGLDVPSFLVSEIIHNYYTSASHHHAMRAEMFALMAVVMVDPVTMSDAETVLRLVNFATGQSDTAVLLDILRHTRCLIATRPPQLASFLGRRDFSAELIPLLNSPLAEVRNETLLHLCLLVSRSRRTQELLNPALLSAHEVVHVVYDVSLAWLRDKLHMVAVDESLYVTLRAALIGRFDAPLTCGATGIEPIGRHERILFAPALTPLLQLTRRGRVRALKERAMADVAALAQQDPAAWKEIVSVRGWYASVVDLYLSEEGAPRSETEGENGTQKSAVGETDAAAVKEEEEKEKEKEKEKKKKEEEEEEEVDPLMNSAATIFARVLSQALLHEAYGASELELLIAYLVQQGAHRLLNTALVGVVREFTAVLAARGRDALSGAHFGLGSQVAAANLTSLLCEIEDLLFYTVTVYQPSGTGAQRKRGYTEDEELILCTESQPSAWGATTCSAVAEERHALRAASPDGQWLHTTLALRTMELITLHSALLNAGGGSGGAGFSESFVRGLRFRKGGFLRLFVRLFRVVCSFTLHDVSHLDDILILATRFVQLIEFDQGPFALLRRQVMENKEYSPVSCSLIMILSLHHLLVRRLRHSAIEKSPSFDYVNNEILDRIKCLCILQRKTFSQMQIFAGNPPLETTRRIRIGTLEWLCRRSRENAVADYVEVASRQDFESFIVQCTLTMERDQSSEKAMANRIAEEHARIMLQLHQIITDLSLARTSILESLEQRFQEDISREHENSVVSVERYEPRTARTLANILFNNVWTRFLDRCKGTIWDLDPASQLSTKYVRLLEVEQQPLLRRKLLFDSNGTDHGNITRLGKLGKQSALEEEENVPPPPRLRLRGGEGVLFSSNEDSDAEEETLMPVVASPYETELKECEESSVLFSIPCEVPYMMHCWSATLMIKGHYVCVFFDENNTAYNQRIAEEAESFLIKPRSIIYHSGNIAVLAPGRRFRMKRSAIELWFRDGRSVLINFATIPSMREAVSNIRTTTERHKSAHLPFSVFHENPKKDALLTRRVEQWRDREISNFEYLLWINFFAGRTLNDLTQYPVFPWVVADYQSEYLDLSNILTFRDFTLPIGICGCEVRRARVESRYEETKDLGDVPAHYFTHYSSPAVMLYYMVRVEPFTTLQIILQGGHFDHADRMFHSLASCWQGVTANSQDVRELIPELYYLPELCMNKNRVDFGTMQDKETMDALELPPWAHGDPYEFVYRMREALECDYVSSKLHHWIDLIFGYKQRGKEAIASLNVFNWHSYEDLDKSRVNDIDPQLLIDSLDNIGQTPIQLFTRRHVERRPQELLDPLSSTDVTMGVKYVDIRRICGRVARVAVCNSDRVMAVSGSGAALLFRLHVTPITQRTRHGATDSGRTQSSRGHVSFDIVEEPERRTPPLPPGVVPSTTNNVRGPCESDNVAVMCVGGEVFVLLGGLFDNTFVIRPLASSFGEVRMTAHSGRVVRVAASSDGQFVVTGAEDTTFIVWSCHIYHGKLHVDLLFTVYGHEDNPTAVDVSPSLDLVATASRDGVLMLHSLRSSRLERKLRHPEKYAIDRILIQSACYVPNVLFTSNADFVIHQISVNGEFLRSVTAPGRITSWCASPRQYLIVATSPHRRPSESKGCSGTVHFMHSFFLSPLRAVPCSQLGPESVISSCTVHPLNKQVVLCGTNEGSFLLLRVETRS